MMRALEHSRDGLDFETPENDWIVTSNVDDIPSFREIWEAAARQAPFHSLVLEDYRRIPVDDGVYRRLCLYRKFDSGRELILPCVGITRTHRFAIGARRLFTMKASAINLLNYWVLEGHAPSDIAAGIGKILKVSGADIFTMSEVPVDSALHQSVREFSWPLAPLTINRKPTLHWIAELPEDFETYVDNLSRRTRKNVRRYMRLLEETFEVRLETVTEPDQVERFLTEAERINRMTYQWDLGERIENDAKTREHFLKLATEGRLRCGLLLLDGKAVAFEYGKFDGRLHVADSAGYDPEYARYSVGIVLMMLVLRDLIENTSHRLYDFGMGGDDAGYKSTYGNRSVACNSYYVVRLDRPRGLAIWALQTALNAVKTAGNRLIGDRGTKNAIRKLLRKT